MVSSSPIWVSTRSRLDPIPTTPTNESICSATHQRCGTGWARSCFQLSISSGVTVLFACEINSPKPAFHASMYIRATTAAAAGVADLILGSSLARPSIHADPLSLPGIIPEPLADILDAALVERRVRVQSPHSRLCDLAVPIERLETTLPPTGVQSRAAPGSARSSVDPTSRTARRASLTALCHAQSRSRRPGGASGLPRRFPSIPLQLALRGRLPGRRQLVGFRSRGGRGYLFLAPAGGACRGVPVS